MIQVINNVAVYGQQSNSTTQRSFASSKIVATNWTMT